MNMNAKNYCRIITDEIKLARFLPANFDLGGSSRKKMTFSPHINLKLRGTIELLRRRPHQR